MWYLLCICYLVGTFSKCKIDSVLVVLFVIIMCHCHAVVAGVQQKVTALVSVHVQHG